VSRDPLEWMVSAKALARRATSALGSAREPTAAEAFEASTGNQWNDELWGTPPFRPRSGTAGWRPLPTRAGPGRIPVRPAPIGAIALAVEAAQAQVRPGYSHGTHGRQARPRAGRNSARQKEGLTP
jgi:hypothetical protein